MIKHWYKFNSFELKQYLLKIKGLLIMWQIYIFKLALAKINS